MVTSCSGIAYVEKSQAPLPLVSSSAPVARSSGHGHKDITALQRIVCTTNTSLARNDPTTTTSSSDAHAHAEAQPRVLKRPSTRQLESHTTKRARLGIG